MDEVYVQVRGFLRRLMHYMWIFAALLVNQMRFHVSVVILYLLKCCKEMQTLISMRWHMALHGRGNEGEIELSGYLVSVT